MESQEYPTVTKGGKQTFVADADVKVDFYKADIGGVWLQKQIDICLEPLYDIRIRPAVTANGP